LPPAPRRLSGEAADVSADATLFSPADLARVRFFSEYLKQRANARRDVRDLRQRLFGGPPLRPEQAYGVFASQILPFLSCSALEAFAVPIVGHQTAVVSAGGTAGRFWSESTSIRVVWPGGERLFPYQRKWAFEIPHRAERLAYPSPDGGVERRPFATFSVFEDIQRLAKSLATALPWQEHEATWFLVTGVAPTATTLNIQVSATQSSSCNHAQVRMTVDPWVPPRVLAQVYAETRRQLSVPETSVFLPHLLELYEFVTKRLTSDPKPTWEALRREWMRTHRRPPGCYKDFRLFRKEYDRTRERIVEQMLYPSFTLEGRQEDADRRRSVARRDTSRHPDADSRRRPRRSQR
jgi:hypothetical protein